MSNLASGLEEDLSSAFFPSSIALTCFPANKGHPPHASWLCLGKARNECIPDQPHFSETSWCPFWWHLRSSLGQQLADPFRLLWLGFEERSWASGCRLSRCGIVRSRALWTEIRCVEPKQRLRKNPQQQSSTELMSKLQCFHRPVSKNSIASVFQLTRPQTIAVGFPSSSA